MSFAYILKPFMMQKMKNAILAGDVAAVKKWIKRGFPINECNILEVIEIDGRMHSFFKSPLEFALAKEQFDIVKLLIDSGAEMPSHNSPLIRAIRHNSPELFAYMVEHGAVLEKDERAVVQLLANLVDCWDSAYIPWIAVLNLPIKKYGGSGLYYAAAANQLEMVKYLLSQGVDINVRVDFTKGTPVLRAAEKNHFEMVRFLTEQGADLSIANRYGERPYTAARKNHNKEIEEYIKSREPEELHSEEAQARRFAAYQVPKAMEDYLKSGNLRLEFPEDHNLSWIKLYSYMDVPEMIYKNKKVLSLVEDSDDGDITLVWEPKSQKIYFMDTEEDALCKVGTWEEFIAAPGELLDRAIVWA